MSLLTRAVAALGLCLGLAACAGQEVWAPEQEIRLAAYSTSGPPTVTLFTMINTRSGAGGHSALMIDGQQRVLFDPAGSWFHNTAPERNDVIYGMNPTLLDFYTDYHARETYYIVVQEITVTPQQAAFLTEQVQSYGAVSQAQCARSISTVLSRTPGFEMVEPTWFPKQIMNQIAEMPGVRRSEIWDDDSDNNNELLRAQARAELRQTQVEDALAGN